MPTFSTQKQSSNQLSPAPRNISVGTPVLLQPRADLLAKVSDESRKRARSPAKESEPASKVLVHDSTKNTPAMNRMDIRNIWDDSDEERDLEELVDQPTEGPTEKGGTTSKA